MEQTKQIDYEAEVVESVSTELYDFYEEVKDLPCDELFANGDKMAWYKTFAEFLCESELVSADVFKALYKIKGNILQSLYDEEGVFDGVMYTYAHLAKFVEDYCNQHLSQHDTEL